MMILPYCGTSPLFPLLITVTVIVIVAAIAHESCLMVVDGSRNLMRMGEGGNEEGRCREEIL